MFKELLDILFNRCKIPHLVDECEAIVDESGHVAIAVPENECFENTSNHASFWFQVTSDDTVVIEAGHEQAKLIGLPRLALEHLRQGSWLTLLESEEQGIARCTQCRNKHPLLSPI